MDQMEAAKYVGGICGALLIYLLTVTAADALFSVGSGGGHGDDSHGESHAEVAMPASVYALDTSEAATTGTEEGPSIEELLAAADIDKGKKVYSKCKACHKLEDGANGTGPHLFNVVDRAIADVDGFNYSPTVAGLGGVWDNAALDGFLKAPKKYAPGTKMSFAGLKKATDRANLISYLATIK